jgi:flagellar basal-body rod protein FlgG
MIKGIYTAGRSLQQRTQNIDSVSNNLANLSTVGYKREIPFSEMVNEFGETEIRKLTSMVQGEIIHTNNPMDLAISGKGFFVVKNENGDLELTRDGKFKISDEGFLVDKNGRPVMGKGGEISLQDSMLTNMDTITIDKNGELKVDEKVYDKLLIVKVQDESSMKRSAGANFIPGSSGFIEVPENEYGISQGFLEQANTNPIIEMEEMIQVSKNYESAQKIIAALDRSMEDAISIGKI